jgi:hypothetical protein
VIVGGIRRYDDWPAAGLVTWWWWLEFPDRSTSASGRETRDAAVADATRRALERGVKIVLRELDPGAGVLVEEDPREDERHDEHGGAQRRRDEARNVGDEQGDKER